MKSHIAKHTTWVGLALVYLTTALATRSGETSCGVCESSDHIPLEQVGNAALGAAALALAEALRPARRVHRSRKRAPRQKRNPDGSA